MAGMNLGQWHGGKGCKPRPCNEPKYKSNFDEIDFRKKCVKCRDYLTDNTMEYCEKCLDEMKDEK